MCGAWFCRLYRLGQALIFMLPKSRALLKLADYQENNTHLGTEML